MTKDQLDTIEVTNAYVLDYERDYSDRYEREVDFIKVNVQFKMRDAADGGWFHESFTTTIMGDDDSLESGDHDDELLAQAVAYVCKEVLS
jgi:hypothetical protein